MLVFFALGNPKVLSFALADAKVPNASSFAFWWNIPHFQWNIGCVGSLALGPCIGSLRWACTFHVLGDANCTRRKPVFWWNMGFRVTIVRTTTYFFTGYTGTGSRCLDVPLVHCGGTPVLECSHDVIRIRQWTTYEYSRDVIRILRWSSAAAGHRGTVYLFTMDWVVTGSNHPNTSSCATGPPRRTTCECYDRRIRHQIGHQET